VQVPWRCGDPLPDEAFTAVLRRAVFDCCKWHTHVEDRPVLAPYPLVLTRQACQQVATLAQQLQSESLQAEAELLRRPDLLADLGLPAELRSALAEAGRAGATPGPSRITRFDFHWTQGVAGDPRHDAAGWRVSESNADVCGGLIEASGVTNLMATFYPDLQPAQNPVEALALSLKKTTRGEAVALLHATIYTEDRQVALYLAQRLAGHTHGAWPCGPEQIVWKEGRASVRCADGERHVGAIYRFYPAEWLPRLEGWRAFFVAGRTPVCNPGWSVLTQSKRFPLTWDRLTTPLPTWRALLPESRSPRGHDWRDPEWVIKPALGYEGFNVGVPGATPADTWAELRRKATRDPANWLVQRRFESVPLATPEGPQYPSLGVYVIDGNFAGFYARVAPRPLIDDRAREMVVLIERGENEHAS
jgi:glutathionylspermidine synthase